MKKALLVFFSVVLLWPATGFAQKAETKPWHEWTKEEVDKMLNKSAWGHVVTGSDTSEMTVTFGRNSTDQGAVNKEVHWNYRVRFFSAKPIREAFARQVLLGNPQLKPAQLQNFVNGDYSESIVIAISYDSEDRRYLAEIDKAFKGATTVILREKVFLETQDGRRVLLEEYALPSGDGTGAKFVFPRSVNGKPLVASDKDVIRLVAPMGNGVAVSYRFKVADMYYGGKLEY